MLLVAVLVALVAACRSDTLKRIEDPFSGGYPMYRDETSGLDVIFGTPDLGAGEQRIAFAITARDAVVREPALEVVVRRGSERQTLTARYHPFPAGSRGVYVTRATFAKAGDHTLEIAVPVDGNTVHIAIPVEVAAKPKSPAAGDRAPASRNRVASDVGTLTELTTSTEADPALYRARIADAIAAGRPFVVVFASPAFCTTPLCGPQVEDLSVLAKQYAGQAEFIHVDIYDNPHEIKGDLSRARRSPLLAEWGIMTDEWTFVVASDGRVAARFEAYAASEEVEGALKAVLTR
jgi:hypothetical protein